MSKLSSLTEDKYTLNDIFTKHYQFWLAMPLVCYLLVDFIHVVVFTFTVDNSDDAAAWIHYINFTEIKGDYLSSIISCALVVGTVFAMFGLVSYFNHCKINSKVAINVDGVPFLAFFAFCILLVVSNLVNVIGVSDGWLGFSVRGEGALHQVSFLLILYLCASLITSEKAKYTLAYLFLGVGLMLGLIALWHQYVEYLDITMFWGVCSIFRNQNFYAYFLTMQIMLSASLLIFDPVTKQRVLATICFLLNSFLLAINDTLGCFVACLVAFIFFIVGASLKNKRFSFGALVIFGVFLLINLIAGFWYPSYFEQVAGMFNDIGMIVEDSANADAAGTARWGLWKAAFGYIREKPFLGYGFAGIDKMLLSDTNQSRVHNEYIEYAAYYGIPAAVCYIAGLVSVYLKALRRKENVNNITFCFLVAALGYIASSFFGNEWAFITPFFFILLGLGNSTEKVLVNLSDGDSVIQSDFQLPETGNSEENEKHAED